MWVIAQIFPYFNSLYWLYSGQLPLFYHEIGEQSRAMTMIDIGYIQNTDDSEQFSFPIQQSIYSIYWQLQWQNSTVLCHRYYIVNTLYFCLCTLQPGKSNNKTIQSCFGKLSKMYNSKRRPKKYLKYITDNCLNLYGFVFWPTPFLACLCTPANYRFSATLYDC